jgi:hypothetical protein
MPATFRPNCFCQIEGLAEPEIRNNFLHYYPLAAGLCLSSPPWASGACFGSLFTSTCLQLLITRPELSYLTFLQINQK